MASAYPTTSRPAQLLAAVARLGQLLQFFLTTLTTTGDLLIERVLRLKKTWITFTIGGRSLRLCPSEEDAAKTGYALSNRLFVLTAHSIPLIY